MTSRTAKQAKCLQNPRRAAENEGLVAASFRRRRAFAGERSPTGGESPQGRCPPASFRAMVSL